MQNRDPELSVDANPIGFYEREFYVFSNFSSFQVVMDGMVFPTAEHAYHCQRFMDDDRLFFRVLHASSAHAAFMLAQKNKEFQVENWDEIKVGVMYVICSHKFTQHPYVQEKLRQTGDLPLVEDSPKDSFWGWGPDRQGRNELGKIWMRIRDDHREMLGL